MRGWECVFEIWLGRGDTHFFREKVNMVERYCVFGWQLVVASGDGISGRGGWVMALGGF